MNIEASIREIPDYPIPGVLFRDITTLLKDANAFRMTIQKLADHYRDKNLDKIIGIESRGFIFGASLAQELGIGFVPIRKKGKLPFTTISQEYALEYGNDAIEIHIDAIKPGEKVIIIDDLIATGGTAFAACELLKKLDANLLGCGFVIDLPHLGGRQRLEDNGCAVFSVCSFNDE
jgi:adenine phosphoribosyltransferase